MANDIQNAVDSFKQTVRSKANPYNRKRVSKRPTDLMSVYSSQMQSSINERDDGDDDTSFASDDI